MYRAPLLATFRNLHVRLNLKPNRVEQMAESEILLIIFGKKCIKMT